MLAAACFRFWSFDLALNELVRVGVGAAGEPPTANEALAAALRPRLARMAAYFGRRCGEDPDDLLQEAWLAVLEALPALDPRIGSPEQHLLRRARWRVLDSIRRSRVRRCTPLDDSWLERQEEAGADTEAASSACVDEFLTGLSVPHRRLVDNDS